MPYGGAVTVRPIDPAELGPFVGDDAIGRLVEYFQSGRFTGGRFDRLAGGGDRPDVADVFTSDDIVAVPSSACAFRARLLLPSWTTTTARTRHSCIRFQSALTCGGPTRPTLGRARTPTSCGARVGRLPGINWVTAGKLLARKRPRLIPVYDRVVKTALGRGDADEWWRPLRHALIDDPHVVARLSVLRDTAHIADTVSLLRVLDVCIWMQENGHPDPVVDAET